MATYVILLDEPNEVAEQAIKAQFPHDHYQLSDKNWLVSGLGTTKEISDRLGVSKGEAGKVVILAVNGYFGWHQASVWEWLKVKSEAGSNG